MAQQSCSENDAHAVNADYVGVLHVFRKDGVSAHVNELRDVECHMQRRYSLSHRRASQIDSFAHSENIDRTAQHFGAHFLTFADVEHNRNLTVLRKSTMSST